MSTSENKPRVYTKKVEADNTLVFETRGSGPALVFLHGWSCRRADWAPIVSTLSQDFLTISVDLPGHGEAIATRPWSITEFGNLTADLVRSLDLDEVVVIGHSMGGAVALEAAIRLGDTCRSVIAVDSLTYLGIYRAQEDAAFMDGVQALSGDFTGSMIGLVTSLGAPFTSVELNTKIAAEMAQANPEYAIPLMIDLYRWDMDRVLPLAQCPIQAVVTSVHLSQEASSMLSPHVKIREVDFGGHFFLRENPAATASVLQEMLTN